jgi:hypothetical protein
MARRHGLLGLAALGFLLGALTFPLAHALSISESIHGTPPPSRGFPECSR